MIALEAGLIPLKRWEKFHAELRFFPTVYGSRLLMAMTALYLLFFAIQGSAFQMLDHLPAITPVQASQMAVEGFWQLCQLMVLNLSVLAFLEYTSQCSFQEDPWLKRAAIGVMLCSMAFALLAVWKLGVYIIGFGLTIRRLLAAWSVLVLSFWCILTIVWLLKPFEAIRWGVLFAFASFALMGALNLQQFAL